MIATPTVALVTGGGRGLGRAIGESLAGRGWAVGLLARTTEQVEDSAETIRRVGGEAWGVPADVLDPDALGKAVARFASRTGRLDALVCAAGCLRGIGPTIAADPDAWWADVETSLRGTQQALRAAWPWLKGSPNASMVALVGPGLNGDLAFASGYGAAQAALVRLVECLHSELHDQGVAVYALNPGLVPTDLMNHLLDSPEGRRWLPRFTEAFAEGKEVAPEVAAEMAAWLLEHRPIEARGRVVAAALGPDLMETRLGRIAAEDLGRLRLR
jgi:NAD(P)-dependent dehydrogenase (short-subunit alcohol dehydrogenase family)